MSTTSEFTMGKFYEKDLGLSNCQEASNFFQERYGACRIRGISGERLWRAAIGYVTITVESTLIIAVVYDYFYIVDILAREHDADTAFEEADKIYNTHNSSGYGAVIMKR